MRQIAQGLLCLTALPLIAQGQALTADQIRQVEQQTNSARERNLQPLPSSVPKIDLRILSPEKAAIPKAVDEIEFDFNGIDVEGLTYFPRQVADNLFAPLVNKKVSLSTIREAAAALEEKYRERGFFLARVFIPPQQVKNGVFKIRVVEGYVSQVLVEGQDARVNALVESYASRLSAVRPLDLGSLERVLLLINDIPGIGGTAVLRPGAELGSSELMITVAAQANSHVALINNTGSVTTGPYSMSYIGTFQQIADTMGQLSFGVTATGTPQTNFEGVRSLNARYTQAVGSRGLLASFGATRSLAKPGDYLASLELVSNAYTFGPKLRYPLQRSRASSIYLDAGLTVNSSETTIAGAPLTADKSTVADFTANWTLNGWLNGVQTLGLGVSQGVGVFGAMGANAALPSVSGFEPQFIKYTLSFNRTQALPKNFSLRLQALGQTTPDKLLVGEQITFGSSTLGRGFTPAIISGDRGLGGLLELRYDLAIAPNAVISNPQLYVSRDWAGTRILASSSVAASSASISSMSAGVRFQLASKTQVDLRLATVQQAIDTNDINRNNKVYVEIVTLF